MTVYNELNKIAYIGNASQTLYPIPFEYIDTEDIKVSIYTSTNEFVEEWRYSTQYVIEGENVKVLSGYAIDNTKKLLILRQVDLIQDNKYREGGDFPAKSTETSFDKLTMITQQLQETLDRCVKVEVLDNQTPEELLAEVYNKLDSATDVAAEAISAAEQAQTAADNATTAVTSAERTLVQTQAYVDAAKTDIGNVKDTAVSTITQTTSDAKADINRSITEAKADIEQTTTNAKQDINTTIDEAQMSLSDTIEQAVEDVKTEAVAAAEGAIQDAAATATQVATNQVNDYTVNTVVPQLTTFVENAEADASNAAESAEIASNKATEATNEADEAKHWAEDSRVWATGEDAEVEEIAPGEEEHSSRGYADLAMAIANTPEDVPVDTSTLLALQIIKGPKGDSSVGSFTGDNTIEGTLNVKDDSNHPLKITGMAGTSSSGYQIVDSNGLGDSDFEHYATGDRYGTRITNHNNTSNTSVSVDLYQTNVGRSVLDATAVDTVLVKDLQVDGADVVKTSGDQTIGGVKNFTYNVYALTPAAGDYGRQVATTAWMRDRMPNYNSPANVSWNTNFTAPSNGLIWVSFYGSSNSDQTIKINNWTYIHQTRDAGVPVWTFPVKQGDVINCSGGYSQQKLYFIPWR